MQALKQESEETRTKALNEKLLLMFGLGLVTMGCLTILLLWILP